MSSRILKALHTKDDGVLPVFFYWGLKMEWFFKKDGNRKKRGLDTVGKTAIVNGVVKSPLGVMPALICCGGFVVSIRFRPSPE